jgi:hypothetical protein
VLPNSSPSSPGPENKVQKGVPCLDRQKVTVNAPRLPRNPPQIDHNLPPRNTPKTQKPPIKTPFHHSHFFSLKSRKISVSNLKNPGWEKRKNPENSCVGRRVWSDI